MAVKVSFAALLAVMLAAFCIESGSSFISHPNTCGKMQNSVLMSRQTIQMVAGKKKQLGKVRKIKITGQEGAGRGQRVMEKQMKSFKLLQRESGSVLNDVYLRAPDAEKFFFAGKVLRNPSAGIAECLLCQKNLLLDHGRMLTKELLPSNIQFFIAPGNTEVAVAQQEIDLERVELEEHVAADPSQVGFQPETYGPGEPIYYTYKLDDGKCKGPVLKPDIRSIADMGK
eukprot:CAMPEP_0113935358 /NCGR_PEP_ID=MMETSP1339-20121228/2518_1 /TAXON_ID=94617 /ORGANISM="Fibrocapsa japonica" /LENGTH=227 /DNA_ID=CAMNT_0000937477 /DNA_START=20 /DNA_END=703 /DNA_ORIENTATION=- /assembly_acc=CAM_ASM_000762